MENKNARPVDDLNDQEQRRREKLALYKEKGIDPFGHKFPVTDNSEGLKSKYSDLATEEVREDSHVAIAGRIVLLRKMGKASFFRIARAAFNATFVRISSEKRTTLFSNSPISVTSVASKA